MKNYLLNERNNMTIITTVRNHRFIVTAALVLFAVCVPSQLALASAQPDRDDTPMPNSGTAPAIMETPSALRPRWIIQPPENPEYLYFTGMGEAASETEARAAAVKDGLASAASFFGSFIQSETTDRSIVIQDMGRTVAESTAYDEKTDSYANAVISGVKAVEYYTERASGSPAYKVWVLCRIPRQKAEKDLANFAQNVSAQYAGLLTARPATLAAALQSYAAVRSALEQNPLHRAVAYYDTLDGKTGLYNYCGVQIDTIAASVSFGSLPPTSVRRGEPLVFSAALSSGMFPEIGAVFCRAAITGSNAPPAEYAEYPIERNGTFTARIPTARLPPGNYTVELELQLTAAAPSLRQNPKTAFPLEVRPVQAAVTFEGSPSPAEQRVFSQAVQQALQKHNVPLLAGYTFAVAFTARTQTAPLGGMNILLCDVSVSLASGGSVLFQSASHSFTEMDRDHAVKLATEHIASDSDFWTKAGEFMQTTDN
jgi:hypothetical protein